MSDFCEKFLKPFSHQILNRQLQKLLERNSPNLGPSRVKDNGLCALDISFTFPMSPRAFVRKICNANELELRFRDNKRARIRIPELVLELWLLMKKTRMRRGCQRALGNADINHFPLRQAFVLPVFRILFFCCIHVQSKLSLKTDPEADSFTNCSLGKKENQIVSTWSA